MFPQIDDHEQQLHDEKFDRIRRLRAAEAEIDRLAADLAHARACIEALTTDHDQARERIAEMEAERDEARKQNETLAKGLNYWRSLVMPNESTEDEFFPWEEDMTARGPAEGRRREV